MDWIAEEKRAQAEVTVGRWEKAAEIYRSIGSGLGPGNIIAEKYLSRAATLYERNGRPRNAAGLWLRLGRKAKASRLMGVHRYDVAETAWFMSALQDLRRSWGWMTESPFWHGRPKIRVSSEVSEKAVGLLADPEVSLLNTLEVVDLSATLSDRDLLRVLESLYLRHGLGYIAAAVWMLVDLHDEFDRVCEELDELELAAVWYEGAGMPERAEHFHGLMGNSIL